MRTNSRRRQRRSCAIHSASARSSVVLGHLRARAPRNRPATRVRSRSPDSMRAGSKLGSVLIARAMKSLAAHTCASDSRTRTEADATAAAAPSLPSVPDITAQIVQVSGVSPRLTPLNLMPPRTPAHLRRRGWSPIDLRSSCSRYVHVRGARGHAHALRRDAAVGDVHFAAVFCADGVAREFKVAAVDAQEARSLANNGLIAPLDRKSARNRIRRRKAARTRVGRCIGARRLDAVARPGSNDARAGIRCGAAVAATLGSGAAAESCGAAVRGCGRGRWIAGVSGGAAFAAVAAVAGGATEGSEPTTSSACTMRSSPVSFSRTVKARACRIHGHDLQLGLRSSASWAQLISSCFDLSHPDNARPKCTGADPDCRRSGVQEPPWRSPQRLPGFRKAAHSSALDHAGASCTRKCRESSRHGIPRSF
jgi:hypothetical protein